MLHLIQKFFNCGSIRLVRKSEIIEFVVSDQPSIKNIIIPHFQQYPLRGTKYLDFCDWVEAAKIIFNKEHLTKEGMDKIILLKSGMNRSRVYPLNYQPDHTIPSHPSFIPLDGNYISGFVSGDGCITITPSNLKKTSKHFAYPWFNIAQHSNNFLLLESFKEFFSNISKIEKIRNSNQVQFRTMSKNLFLNTIIPFFETYPLYGVKSIKLYKIQLILDLMNTSNFLKLSGSDKEILKDQIIKIWEDDSIKLLGNGTPDIT